MVISIILIIVGFFLLIKGADFLVDGSSTIAKKFHIPEIVIGLTIVSIGTSMPELFVSITSALNGYSDMAIGNVLGSNVCNLLLILGLATVIRDVKFQRETRLIEIPMCLAFSLVFMAVCNTNNTISRAEAIFLLALFLLFILYTIFMGIKGEKFDAEDEKSKKKKTRKSDEITKSSMVKSIFYVILGILGLKFGGDLTVNNAVEVAKHFNVSEKIISLTILAIGTSLPELVTSVTAAIKGNSDIAIGNIIGSNIFNMLLIIGVSCIIKPINYNSSFNLDLIILFVASVLLLIIPEVGKKDHMTRKSGILFLLSYAWYIAHLIFV